ncbi:MAG: hypothetical protein K0Q76_3198 [Panacagrimonas sp.]|jgi:uncharacterized membrane protein YcaP (DUF421 family)|nr:YetF domain-containing protein [Panacagrimonas sp.]MCC2658090.1 hypothetical protein [Panacagrimonas sp.]
METVLRAITLYALLLVIFRISGKRSLAQITTFDFVLLLVIGEATQQALIGNDFSITSAALAIITLTVIDIGLAWIKHRSPRADRWLDDVPIVIVEHGRPLESRMRNERVDVADVLAAAREHHGLERLSQIRYAVLERNGEISIVPEKSADSG